MFLFEIIYVGVQLLFLVFLLMICTVLHIFFKIMFSVGMSVMEVLLLLENVVPATEHEIFYNERDM
jgi:hypothetical protein